MTYAARAEKNRSLVLAFALEELLD
jgi:hypothetical protein